MHKRCLLSGECEVVHLMDFFLRARDNQLICLTTYKGKNIIIILPMHHNSFKQWTNILSNGISTNTIFQELNPYKRILNNLLWNIHKIVGK